MIYLDNAATTFPKPKQVVNAVTDSLLNLSANPGRSGHSLSQQAAIAVYEVREKVARFFGASSAERVVFTPNCTASINYVLKGLLKRGDRVLTSSLEHNAVVRPLTALKKYGIYFDIFEADIDDADITFRNFVNAVKPGTRLVICTHASNVTGTVLPIEQIGQYCRQRRILFAVDAAQSAGVLNIDMEKMGIDYLCIAAHKGLYAPMGTGMLIIAGDTPDTIIEGGTGTESINLNQPTELPERFESGTINLPGIVGIGAGIDFINEKGIERILSHERQLIKAAYERLSKMSGVKLYTNRYLDKAPILSFNIAGINSVAVANELNQYGVSVRAGLHCAPFAHKRIGTIDMGTVRIAPSAFTSEAQMIKATEFISKIAAKSKGIF